MGSLAESAYLIKRAIFSFFLISITLGIIEAQQKTINNKTDAKVERPGPGVDSTDVGYSTQKKSEIISSIVLLKSEEFNKGYIENPIQLIQGRVAGLSISKPGGDPNGMYNIRLRGLSSFCGNTEPLIVIDGAIGASLDNIDPDDIESISVIKDGSAAIYGLRGSGGVILVTSKKGKKGKLLIEYNGYTSAETVAKALPAMDATQWRALSKETSMGSDFNNSTDWAKELSRTAISIVQNIALSGGSDKTTFRASFNFRNGEGVMINTGYSQLNGRINFNQKALKGKLNLDLNAVATERNSKYGFAEAFSYAAIYNPTSPVRSNSPAYANYGGYFQQSLFNYYNPVAIEELDKNEGKNRILNVSVNANYEILKGLKFNAFYSFQTSQNTDGLFYKKDDYWIGLNRNGFASKQEDNASSTLFESTLSFKKSLSSLLNLTVLGGYSNQEFKYDGYLSQGGNFPTDNYSINNLGNAILHTKTDYDYLKNYIAFFGSINLNLNNVFFLSGNMRYEGSSLLGTKNKWNLFPSLGIGADFSKVLHNETINILKLRLDYDITGNLPLAINRNPDLKPEKKGVLDAGLDFSLFNSRLYGSLDYYTSTTKDLIVQVQVPVPPNIYGYALMNIGKLSNSGLELSLNLNVIQKSDFLYSINFTPFYNLENTLISLSGGYSSTLDLGIMGSPGQNQVPLVRLEVGKPVGQLLTMVFKSIDANGNLTLVDVDKNGIIDAADRKVVGNGLPKFIIGFGNMISYKNWDLHAYFRGVFGHDLINSYRALYEVPVYISSYNLPNTASSMRNYSSGKFLNASPGTLTNLDVENASFISLDNLSLGYTFNLAQNSRFNKIRLYLAGNNIFYITKYKGADPNPRYADSSADLGTYNNPLVPGIDRMNTWPRTRSITFGANIVF